MEFSFSSQQFFCFLLLICSIESKFFSNETLCSDNENLKNQCCFKVLDNSELYCKCKIVKVACMNFIFSDVIKKLSIEITFEAIKKEQVNILESNTSHLNVTVKTVSVHIKEDESAKCTFELNTIFSQFLIFANPTKVIAISLKLNKDELQTSITTKETCLQDITATLRSSGKDEFLKCNVSVDFNPIFPFTEGFLNISGLPYRDMCILEADNLQYFLCNYSNVVSNMGYQYLHDYFITYWEKQIPELKNWFHLNDVTLTNIEMLGTEKKMNVIAFIFEAVFALKVEDRIEKLNTASNDIKELTIAQLKLMPKPFTKMLHLNLSNNNIKEINSSILSKFPNLEVLDLSENYFAAIPRALNFTSSLKKLCIGSSKVSNQFSLQDEDLTSLSNLTFFSLSGSNLYNSNLEALRHLSRLEILHLNNCQLQNITMQFLYNLSALHHLELSGNRISSFIYVVNRFPHLQAINLSGNYIREFFIRSDVFCSESVEYQEARICDLQNFTIQSIDLSNNDMTSWKSQNIPKYLTILSLNLSRNKLEEISEQMMKDFNQVDHLNLENNRFDCFSCHFPFMKRWLKETECDVYGADCLYPSNITGVPLVKANPDLSHCLERVVNWLLIVGLPSGIVVVLIIFLAIIYYYFRWYVRYFMFWIQLKLKENQHEILENECRYDAFVSFSHKDSNWILEQLIPNMEQIEFPYHLCFHERDFEVGELITNNIIKSIDTSRKTIFLISQSFIDSQWCMWELSMAEHKLFEDNCKVIILVVLEQLTKKKIPSKLKQLMRTQTYLPWPNDPMGQRLFWLKLRQSIGKSLSELRSNENEEILE